MSLDFPNIENWEEYEITTSGYFYGLLHDNLLKLCK
jgi:hypothetical protein